MEENLDSELTLAVMRLLNRSARQAAPYVRLQMLIRVARPMLELLPSSTEPPPPPHSISSQMWAHCWNMTTSLVQLPSASQWFVASSGLERLLELSQSTHWVGDVVGVVESLVAAQLRLGAPSEPSEPPLLTPLTLFEYLLTAYLRYLVRVLERQTRCRPALDLADRCRPVPDANGNVKPVDLGGRQSPRDDDADEVWPGCVAVSADWTQHLDGLDASETNLTAAVALWQTAARLTVSDGAFHRWLQPHLLAWRIRKASLQIAVHLSDAQAAHWSTWALLLEHLVTVSLVLSADSPGNYDHTLMAVVQRYSPDDANLALVCELLLRCATLERWRRQSRSSDAKRQSSPVDEDAATAAPDDDKSRPLTTVEFPWLVVHLLHNLAFWFVGLDADSQAGRRFLDQFLRLFSRMAALAARPAAAAALNRCGVVAVLLGDLKPLLLCSSPDAAALRHLVLRISASLMRHSVSAADLQLLIDLFKEERPPLHQLLAILTDLISVDTHKPTHVLAFPDRQVRRRSSVLPSFIESARIFLFRQQLENIVFSLFISFAVRTV